MRNSHLYIILIFAAICAISATASLQPMGATAGHLPTPDDTVTALLKPDSLLEADSLLKAEIDTTAHRDSTRSLYYDKIKTINDDSTTVFSDLLSGRKRLGPKAGTDTASKSQKSKIRRIKTDITEPVDITAKDSMVLLGQNMAYLYGSAVVTYGQQKITADEIELNTATNTLYAIGREDSLGEVKGTPVFTDRADTYESKIMQYNFKTGKGHITDVITQQGEGFLTGGVTKKIDENTLFMKDVKYTTCDHHENPHFYMQLTKAKTRPNSDIVTGPAYMVLAGLPLPLAVPFGYFPFSEKYSSGIIFPTFGDDYNRGFYLSHGGYYFAISDNIDLALTGEVYTKGSWGLQAQSAYVKRYRYSGNFNLSYLKTILGDKGSPDYSTQTNFQILWNHTQDAKANPSLNFSASVNFTTSGYSRNDLNSYYNSSFTENTKSSTINLTYRPPGSKWSFSTNANISQRTQDSTLNVSFPNVTITMSQLAPFKRKYAVGAEKWYEKIKLSYSGQFNNSLTAKQDVFFQKSLIKDWRNGMRHSIPISATFNLFKYINLTPSINLNDRMYTTKVRRDWDPNASVEVCDTSYSLYNVWDFTTSMSLDTKVYGFFQPLPFLGDKVKMIRHVMTPSVSFSWNPDFSSPFFGYYGTYTRTNAQGETITNKYSMFPNSLFGVPGSGRNGSITYSLANNVEMKVRDDNDSIGERKISLIENFDIRQSYNFAADSLNWSNIQTNLLLRLTKNFNLNLSATWDVYTYQLNSAGAPVRVNIPRWKAGKGIGRLSSTGTSFSYTFNNSTFKRKKKETKDDKNDKKDNPDTNSSPNNQQQQGNENSTGTEDGTEFNADGYANWQFPWNLSVNYSIGYAYGDFNKEKMEYNSRITQNLSFSGNVRPTKGWSFNFSASYDFNLHKIAYMNCNVSRDLHCFTMTASFVPVGPYKSYNFHIAVNSSLLSDLKYDKRSSLSNGIDWY